MADTDIPYDPAKIEKTIQSYWDEHETFSVTEDPDKEVKQLDKKPPVQLSAIDNVKLFFFNKTDVSISKLLSIFN